MVVMLLPDREEEEDRRDPLAWFPSLSIVIIAVFFRSLSSQLHSRGNSMRIIA